MIRVALLVCALAHAAAHVYERCELARELTSLGVHRDHLATWVCIAYHESRFDTSARNHGSGDHGLFQISELYWCGPGKACGAPCSAFRDEDISDDLACALKIHKEHTVLQGDGYLAWVVYPHHCKHINAKKYLVDCEASLKNDTSKLDFKSRSLKNNYYTTPKPFDANYYVNSLKPSFLSINSLLSGIQPKQFEDDGQEIDWVNFKYDDIDNIKLPVVSNDEINKFVTPASTTTTANDLEPNYFGDSKKTDWVNFKIDNIDDLKLPSYNVNNKNRNSHDQLNWLNIKIDSKIDDLKLPIVNNNALIKHVTPVPTAASFNDHEQNYFTQSYKNDWINFKIDNIDDIKLPAFNINEGNLKKNNYNRRLNWLNIKIDSKIDDVDIEKFTQRITERTTPKPKTTTTKRTTTTTMRTTIDPELIGIKPPMPRRIESNQFRRRMMLIETIIATQDAIKNNIAELQNRTDLQSKFDIIGTHDNTTLMSIPQTTTTAKPFTLTSPSTSTYTIPISSLSPIADITKVVTTKNIITVSSVPQENSQNTERTQNNNINSVTQATLITNEPPITTKTYQEFTNPLDTTVKKLINKNSEFVNVLNITSKSDAVGTTPLPAYNNKSYQVGSTTSTTTSKPTLKPWNFSPLTTKPDIVTSTQRSSTYDWNKRFQERYTFKPFSKFTQRTTTSRPNWTFTSRTSKPVTSNISKTVVPLNISKVTLAPTTTAKPYLSVNTSTSTSNRLSTSIISTTASTMKTTPRNIWTFKPFLSTTETPNVSKFIQDKWNTLKPVTSTENPTTKKNRYSFSFSSLDFNKSPVKTLNPIKPVHEAVENSTDRNSWPAWSWVNRPTVKRPVINKSELTNSSNFGSFTLKPVTVISSTLKPFSTAVNSSANPSLKTQVISSSSSSAKVSTTVKPSTDNLVSTTKPQVTLTVGGSDKFSIKVKHSTDNFVSTVKPQVNTFVLAASDKFSTTMKPSTLQSSAGLSDQPTTKSTPSIFDLYLRPDKFKAAQKFQFPPLNLSANKLTIFTGGTTQSSSNVK